MIFTLTDSLTNKILFAMEDQKEMLALNAHTYELVSIEDADEENVYSLPFWGGDNGFKVLEDFTNELKDQKIKSELKVILSEGRGVFRNFKNKLKDYPEVEHGFYEFKENAMKKVIQEWYEALQESWNLVLQDFNFTEYDQHRDDDCITQAVSVEAKKLEEELPAQFATMASTLYKSQFTFGEGVNGFVCRTLSDEFAGCVLFSRCQSPSTETAMITGLVVVQNCRGIGIAKVLMEKCISNLRENGFKWLLIAANFIPQMLEPLFEEIGFKKTGNVFSADLTKIN